MEDRLQKRQHASLTAALALTLIAITLGVLLLLIRNVQAVSLIRENAEQTALIADLDGAVEILAGEVGAWVAGRIPDLPEPESWSEAFAKIPPGLADTYPLLMEHPSIARHPSVIEAIQLVDEASAALLDRLDPGEQHVANRLTAAHRDYVDSIVLLSQLEEDGGDVDEYYNEETFQDGSELRAALLTLHDDQNQRIRSAIVEAGRVENLLRWWMPALFIAAMVAAGYLLRLQALQRREQVESIQHVSRAKDRFIASVSHELRTPLTGVIGFAQELRNNLAEISPGDLEEMIGLIAEQSLEVGNIVEDLLVAARADAGNLTVLASDVDLLTQVESVVGGFPEDTQRSIVLTSGTAVAFADETRVRQILRNLLTNAMRYGGERIEVAVSNGPAACLTVRDNGAGIPESQQKLIFEPYYRVHEKAGRPDSVGLGLTVSRQLARLMGGDLSYRYEGGWSVMELALPLARLARPTEPAASSPEEVRRLVRDEEVGMVGGIS